MTRFANIPVTVPQGVEVSHNNNKIAVKGPLGSLDFDIHHLVKCEKTDDGWFFKPKNDQKPSKAQAGTAHRIVVNMLQGVSEGFAKNLELHGVGYRVEQKGQGLVFLLGFSNPINFKLPEGITAIVDGQTKLTIKGIDKQKVGQISAEIR
ncbi:MAG: 50S ribosomal protein L6, partial [Candidatus Portiera sp.]|nr:50S ribosomal protein L6 [Portiera sp.]